MVETSNWGMRMRKEELMEIDCQSWEGEEGENR